MVLEFDAEFRSKFLPRHLDDVAHVSLLVFHFLWAKVGRLRETNHHMLEEFRAKYFLESLEVSLFALIEPGVFCIEAYNEGIDLFYGLQDNDHLRDLSGLSPFRVPETGGI